MKNMQYNKNKSENRQGTLGRQRYGFVIIMLAVLVALVLLASYGIMDLLEKKAHDSAESLVSEVVAHIDGKMNEVENATREIAHTAYAELGNPEALEQLVRDFVSENAFVYGSTVAFEPDVFPEKGRCFAPYSWKTADGEIHSRQLGTETDYYQEEWYAETKASGEEYWCEPYFDEGGAKIMMSTFSIPLKDSDGQLVAVMTADVGLADLEEYISTISPTQDSYIVLRSRNGSPLANAERDTTEGSNKIIIKGLTDLNWSVELVIPFTYLMHGDSGTFFLVGTVFLATIVFVYIINRIISRIQQSSSREYMNVIDSISSGFSSIHLVNLLTNEIFSFREPEEFSVLNATEDVSKLDFTDKLARFIDYNCFDADRERMQKEISLPALRENLRSQDRYEVRFRKSFNSEVRWYEMHVFTMERDSAGAPIRAVVAFTDVNESVLKEKENQDTLEQALTMAQSASKAKTDFLFNMSHDIRTPMNAILGFTNLAKKHIDDRERVLDCLEKTQQSGNLLLALINSVLDVSRIESGQAKLEEKPADVELSFGAIEGTLKELAAASDIDLSFEIGQIENRYVYCDLDRCNRIFVNIISNAIKYTPSGGKVNVRCEQIESTHNGFGYYRYVFEDNGIGMSEEFQKTVFDQFTREKTATVSGIQGSGLGMAVCKSFVDLMGGTIECQSKLGVGTTFTVTLPFRLQDGKRYVDPFTREEYSADEERGGDRVNFSGRRVLLVEDNELNREIAEELLEDEGLIVDSVGDGVYALDALKEKGPGYFDFVLMDIQMPRMNGYEAAKAIRELYPDVRLPIIALSANAFDEDRKKSLSAGMDDHVAKPINVNELFAAMAKFQ